MNPQKTGLRVASILFAIFAVGHLIRLIKQIPVQVGRHQIPMGTQLGGAHHCSCSLHLAMAAVIQVRDLKRSPTSFACHAEALAEGGHFPSQSAGVST